MRHFALALLCFLLSACAVPHVYEGEVPPRGLARAGALLGEWSLSDRETRSELGALSVTLGDQGQLCGRLRLHEAWSDAPLRIGLAPRELYAAGANPSAVIRLALPEPSSSQTWEDQLVGSALLAGRSRQILARRTLARCASCGRSGRRGRGSLNRVSIDDFLPAAWELEPGLPEQEVLEAIGAHQGHSVALSEVRLRRIEESKGFSFFLWAVLGFPVAWIHREHYEISCSLSLDGEPAGRVRLALALNYFERNPSSADLLLLATAVVFPTPLVCTEESAVALEAFRRIGAHVRRRLESKGRLQIALGVDPTAPSDEELLAAASALSAAPRNSQGGEEAR